jgi:hypothetical protein
MRILWAFCIFVRDEILDLWEEAMYLIMDLVDALQALGGGKR